MNFWLLLLVALYYFVINFRTPGLSFNRIG